MRAATPRERLQDSGSVIELIKRLAASLSQQPVARMISVLGNITDEGFRGNTVNDPRWKVASMPELPKSGKLLMDQASRMDRAQRMGFTQDAYHGTAAPTDFGTFDPTARMTDAGDVLDSGSGSDITAYMGSHFAETPNVANKFALPADSGVPWLKSRYTQSGSAGPRVMPVKLRGKLKDVGTDRDMFDEALRQPANHSEIEARLEEMAFQEGKEPEELFARYDADPDFRSDVNATAIDEMGKYDEPDDSLVSELASMLRAIMEKEGYAGAKYRNVVEGGNSFVMFDPKNIRSRFATFDPRKSGSSDLLASISALAAASQAREKQ
jgi:hypothetical protein